jgi:hypothetical protein
MCIAKVPQAGKELVNAGWLLTCGIVILAVEDQIWNMAAQTTGWLLTCGIVILAVEDQIWNSAAQTTGWLLT